MIMIPAKVKKILDAARIKYEPITHKTVYTAYDKAATLRVPEKIVGKTLVVKLDNALALVTVPANRNLDKNKLKKAASAKKVDFATERLIKNRLKGVKIGAVPPFGVLWELPTFVDRVLMKQPKIIVNGGAYKVSLRITSVAHKRLAADMVVGNFSKRR